MADERASGTGGPAGPGDRGRPAALVVALAISGLAVMAIAALAVAGTFSGDDVAVGVAPRFVDDTGSSGVDHVYDGEFEFFVGGGVAAFDCDGDGRDELYLAGGANPAALYRNRSAPDGSLSFAREPSPVTDLTAVTGAYPLDVDGDRITDLAVLRNGANALLRGLGDCSFEDATADLGLDGGDELTVAFSATWEGAGPLPTLAFGSYVNPDRTSCADSELVRPDPSGEAYAAALPLRPSYCTLSMLFSDWSRSGRADLRLANDRHYHADGEEQLWRIEPGRPPRPYGRDDGWQPLQLWGMGLASRDLTGDGYPEVFITSQGDNKLQTLADDPAVPSYRDIALRRGVTAQRPFAGGDVLPSTAWHPEFADVNNDGLVDLFVTKGNVEAQPDHASRDPDNLLLAQPDGTFTEGAEAAGVLDFDPSRGAALVDLNLDGMLDLVVVHRRSGVTLHRNVGAGDGDDPRPTGHWLAVRLLQPGPNVDAIGAWLDVRVGESTASREVTIGGGHAGGQLGWLHTGLGDARAAEVRVRWPDGEFGPWIPVEADRFVTVERGASTATRWEPAG